MFLCPNCNGNLRFDIESQKMHCQYCDTYVEPEDVVEKDKDATSQTVNGSYVGQDDMMEVTIYTCPQCSAELMSTDQDATAFCSYCGAANILSERISHEKKPDHIIPFKITKEQCKQAYVKKMKKSLFAPKDLTDSEYIDGFRGIYMPYWSYNIEQDGMVYLEGTKEHRSGDYRIIDHYQLRADVDGRYSGLAHDASTSFADNISESLAPYDTRKTIPFRTAYLSGFYADIADVDSGVYEQENKIIAANDALAKIKREPAFKSYSIQGVDGGAVVSKTHTETKSIEKAMFPVWFMSYRRDNRVAYAAINGQTGKVTADIPIDIRKYLCFSAVIALAIWAVLCLFATLTLGQVLTGSTMIALLGNCIYGGILAGVSENLNGDELGRGNGTRGYVAIAAIAGIIMIAVQLFLPGIWMILFPLLPAAFNIYEMMHTHLTKGLISNIVLTILMMVSFFIVYADPAADYWYFVPSLVLAATVVWCYSDILFYYNQLMTRPLPQFNKTGGDDNA